MKIRTIKPEFWQSEKLATRLSLGARMLFIGLWGMADDYGRFRAHPGLIRGEVFPYEDDAPVAEWLAELAAIGVVTLYRVDGSQYGYVTNFAEHQKIDQRWRSKLPAPPGVTPGRSGEPAQPDHDNPERSGEEPESPAETTQVPAEDSRDQAGDHQAASPVPAEDSPDPTEALASPADSPPTDRKGKGNGNRNPSTEGARARANPDPVDREPADPGRGSPTPKRPAEVSEPVWADWIAHRRRLRADVTETALAGIRREAEAAGMSLEAAMAHSVTQGWRGFKAEWVTQNRDGKPKALAPSGIRIAHPERMPVPYDSPTGPCFCALCVKARARRVAQ